MERNCLKCNNKNIYSYTYKLSNDYMKSFDYIMNTIILEYCYIITKFGSSLSAMLIAVSASRTTQAPASCISNSFMTCI